jgi:NAD(P)-dependent dehydrogenase (short-subunit alcohol dehydrogenase family)
VEKTVAASGRLDMLINNAGLAGKETQDLGVRETGSE